MRGRLRATLAVAALSLGFQAGFIGLDAFYSDEGLVLLAAADVAKGDLLYRDCYVPLTPAVYLLQGIAFKLAGSHFAVSRALVATTYAATAAVVTSLAACSLPVRWALLAGGLAIPLQIWMWPHAQFFSYNALATLFCLLAVRLAWGIEARRGRLLPAAAMGGSLALALWTKPNLALAVAAGILVYWLSGWLRTRWNAPRRRDRGAADLLREGGAAAAGAALASAPLLAYLAVTGTFGEMVASVSSLARIYSEVPPGLFPAPWPPAGEIDALRLFPGRIFPGALFAALWRQPAFQYLLDYSGWVDLGVRALYWMPVALQLAVGLFLLARLRRGAWEREDEAALLLFVAGVFLHLTVLPHPALHYVVPTLLPLLVLLVYASRRIGQQARGRWRWALSSAGLAALAVYAAASLAALLLYTGVPREPVATAAGTLWLPSAEARRLSAVLDHLRENAPRGAEIFVAPHFPMLHFLTRRGHPTRYVDLRPGSPGPEAEDEIIAALEERDVDWAVTFPGVQFPALERWESAYPRLHRYLELRFEPRLEVPGIFGTWAEVRRRRPTLPPTAAASTGPPPPAAARPDGSEEVEP